MEVVIFWIASGSLFLIFATYRLICYNKQYSETSHIELPNGHSYEYRIGTGLKLYDKRGGSFNGIEVYLPKEMPHIYLDSLRGGGYQVRFLIDPEQKIVLEGNFNSFYNVFVPNEYRALALSILSPDVMVTLQDHATYFDVELYGDRLRIITDRHVKRTPAGQAALLLVATKVLGEIDHRLASWSKTDSNQATTHDLRLYPQRGYRVAGRYFRYQTFWLSAYMLVAASGIVMVGLYAWLVGQKKDMGLIVTGTGALILIGLTIFINKATKSTGFYSRRSR